MTLAGITDEMIERAAEQIYGGPHHRFKVVGGDLVEYTVAWDEVVEKLGAEERDRYLRAGRRVLTAALAGCAVVELPEPDGYDEADGIWWWNTYLGRVESRTGKYDQAREVSYRVMAVAMLAAAEHNKQLRLAADDDPEFIVAGGR